MGLTAVIILSHDKGLAVTQHVNGPALFIFIIHQLIMTFILKLRANKPGPE